MQFKKVFIEITNFCGLDCTFCTPLKSTHTMPLSLFEKISKEVKDFTHSIALHILGDPLSIPNLEDYLEIARDNKLAVDITTSGYFLHLHKELLLHHSSIHQINFSLMSMLYQRKTVVLEDYFKELFDFLKAHQELKKEFFVNLRLWNLNTSMMPPKKNEIFYCKIKDFFQLDTIYPINTRLAYKIHLIQKPFFSWSPSQNKIDKGHCYGGLKQIGILSDGRVVPCCFDTQGNITLGDLKIQNLKDIFQTTKFLNLIKGFKQNKRIEEYCKSCTYPEYLEKFGI